jgi:hypothetical protein
MVESPVTGSQNEFGEVELPTDWRQGLPQDILAAVEAFVLIDDLVLGTARVDAIQFLLNLLLDADTPDEIEAFVRRHEGSDLMLGTDSRGRLEPVRARSAAAREAVVIPKTLFGVLAREVMTLPDGPERTVREASLREGLGEATGWLVDQEKLLGHLLLAHAVGAEAARGDHDSLLSLHSGFHRLPQHASARP